MGSAIFFEGEAVAGDGHEGIQAVFHERGLKLKPKLTLTIMVTGGSSERLRGAIGERP